MNKTVFLNFVRKISPLYALIAEIRDFRWLLSARRRGFYSQHGEDKVVAGLFRGKRNGRYIDIGASHPFRISNTYYFYRQGWSGVTVEPIPRLAHLHQKLRPRDRLLPCGVGLEVGEFKFYEMTPSVLSTLDASTAQQYLDAGRAVLFKEYKLQVIPIEEVCQIAFEEGPVDFMSIDVEGLDFDLIRSIDFTNYRPEVICVEANENESRKKIKEVLERAEYQIIADSSSNIIARQFKRSNDIAP